MICGQRQKTLARSVVEEFLDSRLRELDIEIPGGIKREAPIGAFCGYGENDYFRWLDDSFESFSGDGELDRGWVREKIKV